VFPKPFARGPLCGSNNNHRYSYPCPSQQSVWKIGIQN